MTITCRRGSTRNTRDTVLQTHLPVYAKTYGADAVKAALRDLYNERYAREGRAL
jgi:predicted SpoU family rRNA methylase